MVYVGEEGSRLFIGHKSLSLVLLKLSIGH